MTGNNKDISFLPGDGASVFIGEEDIITTLSAFRDLETDVNAIKSKLTNNNCASSPCLNGARCVSLYEAFYCDCTMQAKVHQIFF